MITRVYKLVRSHYDDEELARRAFNVNVMALGVLVIASLGAFVMLLQIGTRPLSYLLPMVTLIGIGAIISARCLYLSHTGRVHQGSLLFITMITLACIAVTVTGGTMSALPIVLIIPVAAAGITLGSGASLAVASINTAALVVITLLEINGVLEFASSSEEARLLLNVVDVSFALFFVVLSIWLSGYSLRRALDRTQQAMAEVQTFAETQRAQREHLAATVERYRDYMMGVTRGNLAARLDLPPGDGPAPDPLLILGRALNDMVATLQNLILQVASTVQSLNQSTTEILAATGQQVASAAEQSAAIGQTTTTVDEVKVIADQAVVRAQEVADASHRTVEIARTGRDAVKATVDSMNRIKGRVEVIADNILALSVHTQQIGDIIAAVNDLAAQSNMLALNAAVEAARAGEQGKGFAVVAQEVRSLADQSRQATAQVRAILEQIQRATNSTVMATEEGAKGVDQGVQLAAQTKQAIEQLAGVIDESAQAAIQLAAGGRQQVTGIEQVVLAVQNINQATRHSLASTGQTEQVARGLDGLARRLSDTVSPYRRWEEIDAGTN